MVGVPERIRNADKGGWVWFWRPSWHWHGWTSLLPVLIGHDEYARLTILLGWPVTGRMIIALWYCGNEECYREVLEDLDYAERAHRGR